MKYMQKKHVSYFEGINTTSQHIKKSKIASSW